MGTLLLYLTLFTTHHTYPHLHSQRNNCGLCRWGWTWNGLFWNSRNCMKRLKKQCSIRNHLPSQPTLPVPPKSDIICSPAKVKFHRRARMEGSWCIWWDKIAFWGTLSTIPWSVFYKQQRYWQNKPHHHGYRHWWQSTIHQEALHPTTQTLWLGTTGNRELRVSRYYHQSVSPCGLVWSLWFPRSQPQEKHPEGECVLISMQSMHYSPKLSKQIARQRETSPCTPCQTLISSMHNSKEPKSSLHLISEVDTTTSS